MKNIKIVLITSILMFCQTGQAQTFNEIFGNIIPGQKYSAKTVNNGGNTINCDNHYLLGKPIVLRSDKDRIEKRSFYLCRDSYAIQFDPAYKTAIWSAENLTSQRLKSPKEPRADDFQPDPEVPYAAQATLNDYKGSHFDRGHLSPAADMKIFNPVLNDVQLSDANTRAMSQSFFLTNMVPQVGNNQNRGIWSDLENQIRNWALEKGQILVVTGPIYEQGFQFMGRSKVAIPTKLYKVLIDTRTYSTIGFVIPNNQIITKKTRKLDQGNPEYPQTTNNYAVTCANQPCNLKNFVVPVAEVERLTSLRFFSKLSQQDHDKIVFSVNSSYWQLNK